MPWTVEDAEQLAHRLTAARHNRGWNLYQACKRMNGVQVATLDYLEGGSPDRPPPRGFAVQIKTAAEICAAYWPDVGVQDFYGSSGKPPLLRFVPADRRARKIRELQEPMRDKRYSE